MVDLFAEAYRLRLMQSLEERLALAGFTLLAGVDEVGRGALAGPVVAAAVILDRGRPLPGVDDSKRLSAAERERLAGLIRRQAIASAVIAVPPDVIDRINILQATRRAMLQALGRLRPQPDCAVVDAVSLSGLGFPCLPVVRGDSISYSVACASILAKVERDRMMSELAAAEPGYGFGRHKGYGAPEHLAALAARGPCPAHRLTFRSVVPRRQAAPAVGAGAS